MKATTIRKAFLLALAAAEGASAIARRGLSDFVPSFSGDEGPSTSEASMPEVGIFLEGEKLDGGLLGDRAYGVLETAMEDYLLKHLGPYFAPTYDLEEVLARVVGDKPNGNGNELALDTVLVFRDLSDGEGSSSASSKSGSSSASSSGTTTSSSRSTSRGEQIAINGRMGALRSSRTSAENLPTPLELELAAGYAWNDLGVFANYLMVAGAVGGTDAFEDLDKVEASRAFPTSALEGGQGQAGGAIVLLPEEKAPLPTPAPVGADRRRTPAPYAGPSDQGSAGKQDETKDKDKNKDETKDETKDKDKNKDETKDKDKNKDETKRPSPSKIRPPQRGDITAPDRKKDSDKDSGKGSKGDANNDLTTELNIAAASSQELSQSSGTNRVNPLWPSLIVGMAVFLITIIVLGYRRQKNNGHGLGDSSDDDDSIWRRLGGRKRNRKRKTGDRNKHIRVHVNTDGSTLDAGDEEIEVEDRYYSGNASSVASTTVYDEEQLRRERERNLDKEYATSCLRPATMGLAPTHGKGNSNTVEEHHHHHHHGHETSFDSGRASAQHLDYYHDEDLGGPNASPNASPGRSTTGSNHKKTCLPGIRKKRKKKKNRYDDDGDLSTYSVPLQDANGSRGIDLPRGVDLTTSDDRQTGRPSREPWRSDARLGEETEASSDMTASERLKFVRYMQSGMTLEQASSHVLSERKAAAEQLQQQQQQQEEQQRQLSRQRSSPRLFRKSRSKPRTGASGTGSGPLDCLGGDASLSPTAQQTLESEVVMEDGETTIHIPDPRFYSPSSSPGDGHVGVRTNNNIYRRATRTGRSDRSESDGGTPQAMVLTEASSCASSFDDNDFARAIGEAPRSEEAFA